MERLFLFLSFNRIFSVMKRNYLILFIVSLVLSCNANEVSDEDLVLADPIDTSVSEIESE